MTVRPVAELESDAPPEVAGADIDADAPLAHQTARGVAWIAGGRLAGQSLQFLATIVLARLLVPADYGLTAVVWVFTSFASLLTDLGLGAALVQSRRMTETDAATAFWVNALVGVGLTALIAALSRPLANLYGHPQMAPLLALASLNFTLSMSVVPTAVLERRLRFRPLAVIDIVATVLSLLATIACAAAGWGAKSLLVGTIVGTVVLTAATFVASGWRLRARPSRAAARRLWRFGSHLTGFNVVNFWARNADNLLLGKFASPSDLGLYNRAYNLMLMPVAQVGGVVGRVLLPVLSRLRDDPPRLRRAYLRVCRACCVLMFPLLYGLAAVAPNFVRVAFGPRWTEMVPLLILLAVSGAPQVAAATCGSLCQAAGRPDLLSTWGNFASLTTIVAILLGLPWGVLGVAIAFTVRAYAGLPLAFIPADRAAGITLRAVAGVAWLPFVAAVSMAVVVAGIGEALATVAGPAATLPVQVAVGAALYLAIVAAWRRDALHDAVFLVLRRAPDGS